MRIVSGSFKGKHIVPPKNFKARPTTDFAKVSLFNILANSYDFEELRVLDLFSGTGGISFEFASRGCSSIDLVEINAVHYNFIKKAADLMGFMQIRTFKQNAFVFLKVCNQTYDLIFADPPYDLEGIETLPTIVFEKKILAKGGIFILEHSKSYHFDNHPNFVNTRKYGSVNFSFFSEKEE